MGMPEIRISFKEITKRAIEESGRSIVLLIAKDKENKGIAGLTEINNLDEIPSKATKEIKALVEGVFRGNEQDVRDGSTLKAVSYRPSKVYLYCLAQNEELKNGLKKLESLDFNFIAYPATEGESKPADDNAIIEFVKRLKEAGMETTAVISSSTIAANSEDVINFVTGDFVVGGKTVKPASYTGRIAGLIAGTPYSQSVTLAGLNEIESIADQENSVIDSAIESGKLTLCWKKGKARIARGVNSRTSITEDRGEQFKKIKLVNSYKFINNAIYKVIIDHYAGKIPNSYDNKCLLIVEIKNFLKGLASEELIEEKYSVGINVKKQREYLKSKSVDVESMDEQEIKEANTGAKVFLSVAIKGVDAMEDFDIEVSV